ncbi:protein of unknown function [Xenorhabdus nematophila AN6/1]|nr:hypothetical protein XNW1_1810002 [Xenorhabdus nematophila str. Websteri]CEK25403.1 protein of unknown function [Xenorhabdus nematophila AN6/1]
MLATTLSEKFTHPLELSRCPYIGLIRNFFKTEESTNIYQTH